MRRTHLASAFAVAAAATLAPAVVAAQPASTAGDPLATGSAALEAGQLDVAESQFGQALARAAPGPAQAPIWYDLCLTRYAAGAYGDAINACYRALAEPLAREHVVALLAFIHDAIVAARVDLAGVTLPDPDPQWFDPQPALGLRIVGIPGDGTRDPAAPVGSASSPGTAASIDAIAPDIAARLSGAPPALPYSIKGKLTDYHTGIDLDAKTGLLFYAPDAGHVVVGGRFDYRRRSYGSGWHTHFYGEYLQGVDGKGGIAAVGWGQAAEHSLGIEEGLSVPWGKDDRRHDVLIPGYTIALHGELRVSYRYEVPLGRDRLSFELSISGGLNLAKAMIRIKDGLADICTKDEQSECPKTPDHNNQWPMAHWMVNLAIGYGKRGHLARYDHSEVFAPVDHFGLSEMP